MKKLKIFLTTSDVKGDRKGVAVVRHIKKFLEQNGHVVNLYINQSTEPNNGSSFADIIKDIKNSDVFIGEMSEPSQTLGFQLATAIGCKAPSLYLYSEDNPKAQPGIIIAKNPSRLFSLHSYNKENLDTVLSTFLTKAQKKLLGSRITFECSYKIRDYIDETSKALNISKGELLRNIIETHIMDGYNFS